MYLIILLKTKGSNNNLFITWISNRYLKRNKNIKVLMLGLSRQSALCWYCLSVFNSHYLFDKQIARSTEAAVPIFTLSPLLTLLSMVILWLSSWTSYSAPPVLSWCCLHLCPARLRHKNSRRDYYLMEPDHMPWQTCLIVSSLLENAMQQQIKQLLMRCSVEFQRRNIHKQIYYKRTQRIEMCCRS